MARPVDTLPATCVHTGCKHKPVPGTKRDFALCRWHLSRVKGIVPWPEGFTPVPDDVPYIPMSVNPPRKKAKNPTMATPTPEPPKKPARKTSNTQGTYKVRGDQVELTPVETQVFEEHYHRTNGQTGWQKIAETLCKQPGQAFEFPIDTFFDRSKMGWPQITGRVRTNLSKAIKEKNPKLKLQIASDTRTAIYLRVMEAKK